MKYIVDAHFPKSLTRLFAEMGFDCRHTLDLPLGNATTDEEIRLLAQREERIIVSKDDDFLRSHLHRNVPRKLLRVRVGNMPKSKLMQLFAWRLPEIDKHFEDYDFIELFMQYIKLNPPGQ